MNDINGIDLNLLKIFAALMREKSVTKAAAALRLTQPAVSMGLSRLRAVLDDELFIRTNRELIATEKSLRIAPHVHKCLTLIEEHVLDVPKFDPATTRADVRISVDDYLAQVVVFPAIKKALLSAPYIRFEVVTLRDRDPNIELQNGLDFAIRANQTVGKNLYAKKLLTEEYLVLADPKNKYLSAGLTLKAYTGAEHILVSPFGGFDGTVDEALAKKGLERTVRLSVGHFSLGPALLKNSDFLLTLPGSIARIYSEQFKLTLYNAPFALSGFHVNLHWHERVHQSPMHKWIRSLF